MYSTLIIIFIFSYLAFSLSTICGGGAGILLTPILNAMLPITQVPGALSIGTFTSSVSRIIFFYRTISWHIVMYFLPSAVGAVWLGAWLLKFINPVYLELIMGLFLVTNISFFLKKPKEMNQVVKPSNFVLIIIGFLAGFLSGLVGVVGLLFNKFYLRYGLTKESVIATRAANEIILHLIKIVLYSFFGLISIKSISVGLVVAFAALMSSYTIKWILPKLSEIVFKKIGYAAMVISGLLLFVQSTQDILLINKGTVSSKPISKGIEAKLQWQQSHYSLEFTYDEGFEFEKIILFSDLSIDQQKFVLKQKNNADKIIVETVYTINSKSYEAYYFSGKQLIHKIDFD